MEKFEMEYFKILLTVVAIVSGFLILWKVPVISKAKEKKSLESVNVSIIIPAYNEEKRISVLIQNFSPFEIIVVNDKSTDDTAGTCRKLGIEVIDSLALEGNWIGKSRACWSGALKAKADTLIFFDADVCLSNKDSLENIITTFCNLGEKGILSIQPFHKVKKSYENLSAIFNVVLMAGINIFTPWGNKFNVAGAFGPCIVCKRDEYFFTGGHEIIKEAVLDDIEIGKNYMKHNLPVYLYSGKGTIDFRMYPEGIAQLFEGWSKNFGSGAKSTNPFIFLLIILWITGGFSINILLIKSFFPFSLALLFLSIILYIIYMLQMLWLIRKTGNFSAYAFIVFVFHHLFFTITFIWSFIQTNILRRVFWRGRKIKT